MTLPPELLPVTIGGQLRRQAPRYLVGLLLLILYQGGQYWFDTRLMLAIDAGLRGEHPKQLVYGLVAVAAASFVVRILSRVVVFNAGRHAEYELRQALLHRLHRLGSSFYQSMSSGEVLSRSTNDLTQLRLVLGFGALNLMQTVLSLASALSVTLSISPRLTLLATVSVPLLVGATQYFAVQMFRRTRRAQAALGQLSVAVQRSVSGLRVVRAFGMEEQEAARFAASNRETLEATLSLARLRGSMGPIMQGATLVGFLVVFYYGGRMYLAGELSAGGLVAFFRALSRLAWPLMALGFVVGMLQRGRAAYRRLAEIYGAEPDVRDGNYHGEPGPRLEVRNLAFRRGEREVLRDLSFVIEPGESVAIVGPTASGKSTLVQLLTRLLPTPRGTVFLGGQDICDLPLDSLRQLVGLAPQGSFLFSTSVLDNLALALPGYPEPKELAETDRERLTQALRDTQIHDELLQLREGLDTVVGERGIQLSGGQKQRTALARALLRQARLLVLDDPLSAVDAETESRILDVLEARARDQGLLLVTNRIAVAARCGRILVLDGGTISESGTHEELLQRGGLYATLAAKQRGRQATDPPSSDPQPPSERPSLPAPAPESTP